MGDLAVIADSGISLSHMSKVVPCCDGLWVVGARRPFAVSQRLLIQGDGLFQSASRCVRSRRDGHAKLESAGGRGPARVRGQARVCSIQGDGLFQSGSRLVGVCEVVTRSKGLWVFGA